MKKLFVSALWLLSSIGMQAADAPLWLRHCAISPDGSTVAFCYKGDLFTVPVTGGRATQLTTHMAHDTSPVWSLDGKQIAFASNREGSFDVYLVNSQGGQPRRLSVHSANEYPETFSDAHTLLYRAAIQQDAADGHFPGSAQVYAIDVRGEGNRPSLFSSLTMEDISINAQGDVLYQDKKGYEDPFRKHHRSPITRDIWLTKANGTRSYRQLTTFTGENRNPVWAADGSSYYYLSEESGSMNVFQANISGGKPQQLTRLDKHPVRYLSASRNDVLCFSYDGELYTMQPGAQPRKMNIEIVTDKTTSDVHHQTRTWGSGEIKASPDGQEVAFVMAGDIYVTSVEYNTTKRITNTPQQERNVDISPDGRTIIYSAERNGMWGVYMTEIVRPQDKHWVYAQELKETALIVGNEQYFQPQFSPDGKQIAYLANRTEIRVYDMKSKKSHTVLEGKYNYSYSDGDQEFCWSPDSRWLLAKYISVGGWNNTDIALIKADGKQVVNLTQSGYSDSSPRWVLGGKAMIWQSDRAGYRSHGSWGAHQDMYIMFFDAEAYDKFRMSKEDLALYQEMQKAQKDEAEKDKAEKEKSADKDKKDKKDQDKKDQDAKDKKEDVPPLEFDLDNRNHRIVRLTMNSSNLADGVLDKEGNRFYYLSAFEGNYDLWVRDLKDGSIKILLKGAGAGYLDQDKDCKYIYMSSGNIRRIELSNGAKKNIDFSAPYDYRPYEQREYIFSHAWQQVKDKFYVKDLHGVDWDGYRKAYERYLPHINNNYDFADMLSELLGELNASHTGARYGGTASSQPVASLGAFFDEAYTGDGLQIKEIVKRGPLTRAKTKIKAGSVITHIDGAPIQKGKDYFHMLAGKVGRKVRLSFTNAGSKEKLEEIVTPISQGALNGLLYERWVEQRKAMTEKLSGGQIGYVHVKGMDSESFRRVYSELLGSCRDKKAVVVDTRHNGGGWLHNDLGILLSGKEFQQFVPRGQYIGSDPYSRWNKPSAVLVCEDNYSNAHGFPFMYKALGLGKLIGAPIAGTMTAVWWESQIDGSLVFGIPQVAVKDMKGNYLENQQLDPDILIYNEPSAELQGEDQQLKAAVDHLLEITK